MHIHFTGRSFDGNPPVDQNSLSRKYLTGQGLEVELTDEDYGDQNNGNHQTTYRELQYRLIKLENDLFVGRQAVQLMQTMMDDFRDPSKVQTQQELDLYKAQKLTRIEKLESEKF